jgi:hypothetical protein
MVNEWLRNRRWTSIAKLKIAAAHLESRNTRFGGQAVCGKTALPSARQQNERSLSLFSITEACARR